MRKYFLIASVITLLWCPAAQAFTLKNFDTPESFIIDPQDGSYYVSNINGKLTDKDGNGYISKIGPKGNSVIQFFIGSYADSVLHAPKGLAIIGEDLIVADIDTVKIFNKNSGKLKKILDLSKLGAQFLNDIAVDSSNRAFISDTLGNQIFLLESSNNYAPKPYVRGSALGQPNGLRFNPRTRSLIVVTFGSGAILEIDPMKGLHVLKRGMTALDGVDYDNDGNLFVSSFKKGEIYRIPNFGRGTFSTFASGLTTPADISVDRIKNEVLIPSFDGNQVLTRPITKPSIFLAKPLSKRVDQPAKNEMNFISKR